MSPRRADRSIKVQQEDAGAGVSCALCLWFNRVILLFQHREGVGVASTSAGVESDGGEPALDSGREAPELGASGPRAAPRAGAEVRWSGDSPLGIWVS